MGSAVCGWTGKMLDVDLSRRKTAERDTLRYAPAFIGGRGVATRIYWEEVDPGVGAFDPDNRLILMSGPLAGAGVQGASRFAVAGKSPMRLPEGFCYGNLGGFFAPALKAAGYDGVVVRGASEGPVYVWIRDGRAEILDAAGLWGRGVHATRDLLRARHGRDVRFVATGVAGENRCRTATLITDHEGSATGGFGAVMGSKHLKAVAVQGTGKPRTAEPEKLAELNRLVVRLSRRGSLRIPLPRDRMACVGKAPCHQCGLDCFRRRFRTAAGREAVRKCQSMIFYMPWMARQPGEPVDTAVDATEICNDLSLCTMEMENVLRWLDACHRAGCLPEGEWGLSPAEMGTRAFFEKLAGMIARREGPGDVLAEGLLRAGGRLGAEAAARFDESVSGVGLGASYSPRQYVTHALLYALEPRQPMAMLHEVSFLIARWLLHRLQPDLSPTSARVFRAAAERFWGSDRAWDFTTYEGKALAAVKIQDRTCAKDSLVLCDFGWPIMDSFHTPDHVGDPSLESRLFSAVTGAETDEAALNRAGERVFHLQRAVLLREGWRAREGDVPAAFNFTRPVETDPLNPGLLVPGPTEEPVSVKGSVLDRGRFEQMREEFYALRGWDPESGLPRSETLEGLGLADVAHDLSARGLAAG